ncbi:copper amine oxidase N-terminal domain-containing protein [Saccharibacillus sp. CPCC 101409]|uniref:copper amine oxidase N-terminal domain-containing protein n=1 Tax=Saccharibacillus sp. CPCC 101409 TaxID=3058041 RepID=UPI0026729A45|nr:copper amine oxidase N-terminal domain-containing protein [Saccharibacillus sp. CPCC 101409]MDO3413015.1 copper amine oxidase N-terminal domain-containing protein [Saccharibacillus sp. CPCC 101409]
MLAVLLFLSLPLTALAETKSSSKIGIIYNDKPLQLGAAPYSKNGTTLVPMRPLFESLGIKITWNEAAQTIRGTKGSLDFTLKVGSKQATVNGKSVQLSEAAVTRGGYTFVPLRFIGEASGALVLWNPYLQEVSIYDDAFLKQYNLTQKQVQDDFAKYLKELADNRKKDDQKTTKPDKKDSGSEQMCTRWRYDPILGSILDWYPCP